MRRVFKTKYFNKWMRKTTLTNHLLCKGVEEMFQGLIEADLGGHILKKRIAIPGKGKSGGVRTLVATKKANRWFFLFGFEKNERANISKTELEALQELSEGLLSLSNAQIDSAIIEGALQEICNEQKK